MKKLFTTLAVAFLAIGSVSAQKTEITVGYGGYTQQDAMDMHDNWSGVNTAWGAVTAGVNFQASPKLWIGPSYTFSSATVGHGPQHSNVAYHSVMLNGRYQYYRNGDFKMYGKAGLGVDITHLMQKGRDSYNKCYVAFQVTPVGAEYTVANGIDLYGELGFGAQGLLQVGVKFKL